MLPKAVADGFTRLLQPLIAFSSRTRINPNWFTTLGLLLNAVAALIFVAGSMYGTRSDLHYIGWGGFFVLMGISISRSYLMGYCQFIYDVSNDLLELTN